LKVSVLQEFLIIDFKYKEKLKNLDEQYKDLLELNGMSKHGGWDPKNDQVCKYYV
jgi:hypothetical protein